MYFVKHTIYLVSCCADHVVSCFPGGLCRCALHLLYQDEEVSGGGDVGEEVLVQGKKVTEERLKE